MGGPIFTNRASFESSFHEKTNKQTYKQQQKKTVPAQNAKNENFVNSSDIAAKVLLIRSPPG